MQGLIIENISNLYKIKCSEKIYEATARGKFKNNEISPVVGDKVEIEIIKGSEERAVIEKILPRNMYIKRPKMANLTQIILVLSIKNPKPDLLMLDKQLAFAEYLEIKPVIILNKIDLDNKSEYKQIYKIYNDIGCLVIETNAKEKYGIDQLKKALNGNISAFSGNSGVGKSTLINAIFNENKAKEGDISKKNKKGKNTTTSTMLYELNDNSYIADTPGFSTFDIGEISYRNLENYFVEFKKYSCDYAGCTHIKEKECNIKKAYEKGEISRTRYENYCKIYLELKNREEYKW